MCFLGAAWVVLSGGSCLASTWLGLTSRPAGCIGPTTLLLCSSALVSNATVCISILLLFVGFVVFVESNSCRKLIRKRGLFVLQNFVTVWLGLINYSRIDGINGNFHDLNYLFFCKWKFSFEDF